MNLTDDIKHKALELGFDLVGVTDASPIDNRRIEMFRCWLESGLAGRMDYLHRDIEKRFNPAELVQNARSVIVVGLNFKPLKHPSSVTTVPSGKVVSYARYEDYHTFLKVRLLKLTEYISSVTGQDLQYKIYVDSATLAERSVAVKAGLGFIGKNQMLINPELGCQIFLGELITNLKLEADKPTFYHSERSEAEPGNLLENTLCSNCYKCIDICPTGALMPNGQFDANKCINYLTIEYKGEIPPEMAVKINDRLFGCEDCILACPYHNQAPTCKNEQFKYHTDRAELDLLELLALSGKSFDEKFFDSPIKRLGVERLKLNAGICLENIKKAGDKNTD